MGKYDVNSFNKQGMTSNNEPNPNNIPLSHRNDVDNQGQGSSGYYSAVLNIACGRDSKNNEGQTFTVYARRKSDGSFYKIVATPCPTLCCTQGSSNFIEKLLEWISSFF